MSLPHGQNFFDLDPNFELVPYGRTDESQESPVSSQGYQTKKQPGYVEANTIPSDYPKASEDEMIEFIEHMSKMKEKIKKSFLLKPGDSLTDDSSTDDSLTDDSSTEGSSSIGSIMDSSTDSIMGSTDDSSEDSSSVVYSSEELELHHPKLLVVKTRSAPISSQGFSHDSPIGSQSFTHDSSMGPQDSPMGSQNLTKEELNEYVGANKNILKLDYLKSQLQDVIESHPQDAETQHDIASQIHEIKSQVERLFPSLQPSVQSYVSQAISDQQQIDSCYAHVVAQLFKKFFQTYLTRLKIKRNRVSDPLFLSLFMHTEYWCVEYGQPFDPMNGFYKEGGGNMMYGGPLIMDLLNDACKGNMYDYLSLSLFMFFYCLIRYGLTGKQYTSQDGGYLSSAITYVNSILEKYRKMYDSRMTDAEIVDEMIEDSGIARKECEALLPCFKSYFGANQAIVVVGDDTSNSTHKTKKLINTVLEKGLFMGIIINGAKLNNPAAAQPSSQSDTPDDEPHAITAVQKFTDMSEIEKASNGVVISSPQEAIDFIDKLNSFTGFIAKNSWGTNEGDGTIIFSEEDIADYAKEYLSACGLIPVLITEYPLYFAVLKGGLHEGGIEAIYPKDKYDVSNDAINLIRKKIKDVEDILNNEKDPSLILEKIRIGENVLRQIGDKAMIRAKKGLNSSLIVLNELLESLPRPNPSPKRQRDNLEDLQSQLQNAMTVRKDYQFAIKYAINIGDIGAFNLLLKYFGPTLHVGDDYDGDRVGQSIYTYICKSYNTMIDPFIVHDMLQALFEYCVQNNYKIKSNVRKVYQLFTIELLEEKTQQGGYIKVIRNALLLSNILFNLYNNYAMEGLFSDELSQPKVIFRESGLPPLSVDSSPDDSSDKFSDKSSEMNYGPGGRKTRGKKRAARVKRTTRRKKRSTRVKMSTRRKKRSTRVKRRTRKQ